MNVLALNSGSNSLKFEVVRIRAEQRVEDEESFHFGETLLSGAYDNIGKAGGLFSLFSGVTANKKDASIWERTWRSWAAPMQ